MESHAYPGAYTKIWQGGGALKWTKFVLHPLICEFLGVSCKYWGGKDVLGGGWAIRVTSPNEKIHENVLLLIISHNTL